MRDPLSRVSRGLVAMALVMSLAVPVHALPRDRDEWSPGKVVKAIKRFVVKTFGDGLIAPRP